MPPPKKRAAAAAEEAIEAAVPEPRAPVRPDKPWPAETVEVRPIESVIEYARNSVGHPEAQILKLAASMAEWGWTSPALVDEDGVLIAGHARIAAARQLGWTRVPVMVARGWTPPQVAAYRLADNRLARDSFFDDDMLALEVEGLRLDGFDLALTGFEPAELEAMSAVPDFSAASGDADGATGGTGSLADRFGVPPFSVLNAREGWWQERKRAWLALGIKSEVGRGENLLKMSETVLEPDPIKRAAKRARNQGARDG